MSLWRQASLLVAMLLVVGVGCGRGGGVDRVAISGSVTYQSKPIPFGMVRFEPDVARGGSGPVGFAAILDGRYTTTDQYGKDAVTGPMRVSIEGFPNKKQMVAPMFPTYVTTIDVGEDGGEFDFEVPSKRRTAR